MYKLFGIPNCDTVKKARTFLDKKGISYEFIDFKKAPPENSDLKRWEEKFGGLPVNIKGPTYRKNKDVFEPLTSAQKLKFLAENTSMIKRPILEKNGKVIAFGFDEENYKTLLK